MKISGIAALMLLGCSCLSVNASQDALGDFLRANQYVRTIEERKPLTELPRGLKSASEKQVKVKNLTHEDVPKKEPEILTKETFKGHPKKVAKKDLDTLAKTLYFEYRGKEIPDVYIAQIGYVVLNRLKSEGYPDTLQGVVYQDSQFSWTRDRKSNKMLDQKAKERSYKIAEQVLKGEIPNKVGNSTHYLNKKLSKATWWKGMKYRGKFGEHTFYEETQETS